VFDGKTGAQGTAGTALGPSGNNVYKVLANALIDFTNPLDATNMTTLFRGMGQGAVALGSTDTDYCDLLVGVPVSSAHSAANLQGKYFLANLEFLNGSLASSRDTFFTATFDGKGSTGNVTINGTAADTVAGWARPTGCISRRTCRMWCRRPQRWPPARTAVPTKSPRWGIEQGHQQINPDYAWGYDLTYSNPFQPAADGTVTNSTSQYAVGAGGNIIIGSSLGSTYRLSFYVKSPTLTGAGVLLHPQYVVNSASAPFTASVAPGEFISLGGAGLAAGITQAGSLPSPVAGRCPGYDLLGGCERAAAAGPGTVVLCQSEAAQVGFCLTDARRGRFVPVERDGSHGCDYRQRHGRSRDLSAR